MIVDFCSSLPRGNHIHRGSHFNTWKANKQTQTWSWSY